MKALVQIMYKEGLRNEWGNKVGKSRMHEYLSDPFYCKKNRWKGQITPGEHEALISEELFNMVQAKLTRKVASPQYKKHFPVFKAKIVCQGCGGLVTWYLSKGSWRGNCNHHKQCPQKGTTLQSEIENQLFSYLAVEKIAPRNERVLAWLTKALKEDQSEEIKYHTKQRDGLTRIMQSADKRIEGAYKDKLDGRMPVDLCERIIAESTKEKEEANKTLQKLSNGRAVYYEAGIAIHELALRAKELYLSPKTTVDDKRLLLSYVFSEISLNNKKITAKYTYAFEFLNKWMPKVNNNFELTKNPSVNGAFSVINNQEHESIVPSANINFEPKKVLILPNDLKVLPSNHEVCSGARTRTWNLLLTLCPILSYGVDYIIAVPFGLGASVSSLYGAPLKFCFRKILAGSHGIALPPPPVGGRRVRVSPLSRSVSIRLSPESCDSFTGSRSTIELRRNKL